MYNSLVLSIFTLQQSSRTFSSSKTELSIKQLHTSSSSQSLANTILLSVSMSLTTLAASCKWNHTVFVLLFFVPNVFHLAQCRQGSSMLWHVTGFPFFLNLSNIPSYVCTTVRSLIHLSTDTWVASTSGLL